MTQDHPIDFTGYLRSIGDVYEQWWKLDKLTDTIYQQQDASGNLRSPFQFQLRVQRVKPPPQEGNEVPEILPILTGLHEYAANHVLLFIYSSMMGQNKQALQQLSNHWRELDQTPFVMEMLSFLVHKTGHIPSSLAETLRQFTQLYERGTKEDAPVSDESRRSWSKLLEKLAFDMIQGDNTTDFKLSISHRTVQTSFTEFLQGKVDFPDDLAIRCLEDLLKHHLIVRRERFSASGTEVPTTNLVRSERFSASGTEVPTTNIEFCHQLIQEYYAAEYLLSGQKILKLSDNQLKQDYLNYLKWTEPLALMLAFVDNEVHGAREAVSALVDAWQDQSVSVSSIVAEALGKIGTPEAIAALQQALLNDNEFIRWDAAKVLQEIGGAELLPHLFKMLAKTTCDRTPDILDVIYAIQDEKS